MIGNDTVLKIEIRVDPKTGIKNVRALDREFDRTGRSGSRAFKNVDKSVAGLNRTLAPTTKLVAGVGAAFGTWQLAGMARDIAMTGAAFKQEIATVGGITRATAADFDKLEQIARDMGETTEWSAGQSAQGLQYLAMAGFDVRQQIAALPEVLDLATAGQIDLGRASDIASNALTAMRLPVEELSRVNDTFVATITSSNTNMEMMAESFKYAAPVAAGYGMRIETLSALIGMLGNAGIQGSMAGTQLAASFSDVNKVFDRYGVSTVRADGSTKDLVDAISLLEERGATAGEIMEIFGERSGRAILALLGQGTEAIRAYITEIENAEGATRSLADRMRDTFNNELKAFNSALESVKIDIFDEYEDDLRSALQDSTRWVRDHKSEIVAFFSDMRRDAVQTAKDLKPLADAIGGVTWAGKELLELTPGGGAALGYGIMGRVLFGSWGPAKILAAAEVLNATFEQYSAEDGTFGLRYPSVSSMQRDSAGFMNAMGNIWDGLTGKVDWNTGLPVPSEEDIREAEDELYRAQVRLAIATREARQKESIKTALVNEANEQQQAKNRIDAALKVAAADKDILAARLGEYRKFYADLEKQIADHAKQEAAQIKELNRLYLQQRDIRKTTEEMLSGLRSQNADPAEQYQDKKQRLDLQFLEAMQLSGQEQVDALEEYKQAVNAMAQEFAAGVEGISGSDIAAKAVRDIEQAYQAQQWAMDELTVAAERQAEADRIWSEELQASARESADEIANLEGAITLLDAQMQAMDKQLAIEGVDLVSPVVDGIRSQLDSLHDKTITITTRYVNIGGGGGPSVSVPELDSYDKGTDYVPETGLYELHKGEAVIPAAQNAGGRSAGRSTSWEGDIHIHLPPEAVGLGNMADEDWRYITRNYIRPELD
jgi:TP901 family phage tail tape measure protein